MKSANEIGENAIGILDGGQATHLETLGFDLSSALWSASLLKSDDERCTEGIKRVHNDYRASGAETIGTLTYQLSDKACAKAGWSDEEIKQVPSLFDKAFRLAREATSSHETKVSLALGPYGAALANGSEYTGDYSDSNAAGSTTTQPSMEELKDFHFHRLNQAFQQDSSHCIDFIAFETIPRLDEAQAILEALEDLARTDVFDGREKPPAYLSFVFPPNANGHLPFSPSSSQRQGPQDIVEAMATPRGSSAWPITGVGINCTKPTMLRPAALEMSRALASVPQGRCSFSLYLYPDGGLVWDGTNRRWLQPDGTAADSDSPSEEIARGWAQELLSVAEACRQVGVWEKVWVGGCCKTGPVEIGQLRTLNLQRQQQSQQWVS